MSDDKHIDRVCIIITIIALLVTVLFMNGEKLGIEAIVDEDAEKYSDLANFTANDQNGEWDTTDAAVITLNGDDAEVSGKGAYVYNGSVVISNAGKYVISGTLNNGNISVNAYDSSKVWILLDGADIRCADNAALRIEEADKVFLTLSAGSENFLTSGEEFSEEALADGTGGVIFARDDLTINGSGSLTISGGPKHGIEANDDLIITGGMISITAPGDGMHANDSLRIMNAGITIEAGDDGLAVSKEGGYLVIESGTLSITSGDDAIHTAGDITVSGGDITISAQDDGIHSDTNVLISEGAVLINKCYDGIEAVTISIEGGDITLYPSDDGLNANGGTGGFPMMGGFGRGGWNMNTETVTETPAAETEDDSTWVRISGGNLTIINEEGRDADGIDSNGDLVITGGTIRVSLPGGGTNNAVDYGSENGGTATISGGTLVASGGAMMSENFDSSSEQPVILYNLSETVAGGTEVLVLDTDEKVLLSYAPQQSFNSIFLSCPEMKIGGSYTVVIGDTEETLTLSSDAVTLGSAGMGAMGGGFARGGGRGGNRIMPTASSDSEESEMSGAGETMIPGQGGMPMGGPMPGFDSTGTPQQGSMPVSPDAEMPGADSTMMPGQGGMPMGGPVPGFDSTGTPQQGSMPVFPDGELPGFDSTMMPGQGGMQGRGEHMGQNGTEDRMGFDRQPEAEPEEETAVSTAKDLSEFGTETWILLGISFIVLTAGLVFAKKYKHY